MTNHFTKLEQRLFSSLLLFLFWIPIPLGSNRPWAWAILELWSFGLFTLWVVSGLAQQHLHRLRPYRFLIGCFLLLQVWVFLQLLPLPASIIQAIQLGDADLYAFLGEFHSISLDSSQTLISLFKGLAYCCILILTLALTSSQKRIKQLLLCMIVTGSVQSLYGAFMLLSRSETSWFFGLVQTERATGTFVYHNFFGNFLVLCLCIGIGLLISKLSKSKTRSLRARARAILSMLLEGKAVVRICLAIMVVGLVMSHSRMGNTAFFISLSVMGGLAFLLIKNRSRSLTVLLVSLMIIDVFIVGSVFGLEKVQQRLEETSFENESRDEIIIDSLSRIIEVPFTGTGAGSFYSSFPSAQSTRIKGFYDHAHNDYVEFAMEMGIPILILLTFTVMWSLYHALLAMRRRRNSLMQGIGFGAAMAIVAMSIQLITDFHLQSPANAIYFLVCLALAWMSRYEKHSRA